MSGDQGTSCGGLSLLILGGTGAVGRELVDLGLQSDRIGVVVAPTRKPLPAHQKLKNPVFTTDLFAIPSESWNVDVVVCALGTTIRKAGSRKAFTTIDHDLPLAAARRARESGATAFGLVSSVGASLNGSFYLRTKAQLEKSIRELEFPVYVIARPSLIETDREEFRPAEALGRLIAPIVNPLLPRQYRSVPAKAIAAALLQSVIQGPSGERILESRELLTWF